LHNECLRAQAKRAAEYKHVAVEVPLGSAQIEYVDRCDQWVPRGGVLRCLIHDDEEHQLVVEIDEQELRLEQFGKLLTAYAGWGMRIEFVPEDEVHRRPIQAPWVGNRELRSELACLRILFHAAPMTVWSVLDSHAIF
jgi:hypothetical protein